MTDNSQKEQYKLLLEKTADKLIIEHKQAELNEFAEQSEKELSYYSSTIPKKHYVIPLPKEDEIISWQSDGKTPLSYYKDNKWIFKEPSGLYSINFGQNYPEFGVDLSEPNASPLRQFQKLLVYHHVPGKNLYIKSNKARTTLSMSTQLLLLFIYLYKNGYLIGANKNYKTLETINVETLRAEVRERIQWGEGRHHTVGFARAIARWAFISKSSELPIEFIAPFSEKDFWGGGLSKEVAMYDIKMTRGWTTIEFDDLQPMIQIARKYIQEYADDIMYLEETYRNCKNTKIINIGKSKDLFQELINYKFTICPETQKPWFEISTSLRKFMFIKTMPWIEEFVNLISSAIFMLFIWTAMRSSEMRMLSSNALFIDGLPANLSHDLIIQVENGQYFDLLRTVTKTEMNLEGKDYLLPLPKIGAKAFAILFEFFRSKREQTGNKYLFVEMNGRAPCSSPVSAGYMEHKLSKFCNKVGVEHHHPHQCRKTLATLMINHDPSALELIKDLLCHKSVAMTVMYLMSLPGVAEDIRNFMLDQQRNKIIDFLADASEGKLAGAAGNRTLDAVARNRMAFKGEALATTIKTILTVFTENANFEIIQTPAAWCLRFPSKVPWTAPCLPPDSIPGEYNHPNPEKCRPWECKDAGHTTNDLHRIKSALKWAKKAASETTSNTSKAYYSKQATYWEEVINQLENGRPDIVVLDIIKQALASGV